jgi:hypothetical protein
VQFPWRWMSILAVPFAYFVAAAVAKRRSRWIWVGGLLVVLSGMAAFFVHSTWWDSDDVATLRAGIVAGTGFDGVDEYDPLGDDHYNLPPSAPSVQVLADDLAGPKPSAYKGSGATVLVERWTVTNKKLRVTAMAPARVALRLLNYPAWRVEVNGSRVVPEGAADSGQMILELPAGESQVSIRLLRTLDRTLGGVFSLLSALLTLGLLFGSRVATGR